MEIRNLARDTDDFTGNVWLLQNSETVLVDVGTGDVWGRISGLESVDKVVITHSHYDHVDNLPKVVDRYGPEVYAYEPDNLPVEAKDLDENDSIELCGQDFDIYHTPGHRDDSICLHSPDTGILFTGDLVFPDGGFGRTDLDQGDREQLIESIKKLVGLDITSFYSGHGEAVTVNASDQVRSALENAEKREPKY